MGCGGFMCSKNALAALNVLYILVAFILITIAGYVRWAAYITDIKLMGAVIACGVFLFLIAIIGLAGAIKHNQVLLFFYMIILFLIFLVQFAVACALLAVNSGQQEKMFKTGWEKSTIELKTKTQEYFDCCGLAQLSVSEEKPSDNEHPSCIDLQCCNGSSAPCCLNSLNTTTDSNSTEICPCRTCWQKAEPHLNQAFKIAGGIGLFFSFTEIFGVWMTVKYRNQKDPKANPSAFL